MDTTADIEESKQGISTDERDFLRQLFDNFTEEILAVSDSYDAKILSESKK